MLQPIKIHDIKEDLVQAGKSNWRLIEETILTGLTSGFVLSVICLVLGITIGIEKSMLSFSIILLAVINIRFVSLSIGVLIMINAFAGNTGIRFLIPAYISGLVQLAEAVLTYLYGRTDATRIYKSKGQDCGSL